ncbi:MAG: catalase [Candidatus Solibacter sp.]
MSGLVPSVTRGKPISRAIHLDGKSIPITVRFSDGAPDTTVADNSPEAAPRGMAIRFAAGWGTDIMAFSHNGFLVGTGEEFLALVKAQAATDASAPHLWPIEEFLNSHPRALKFVQDPKPLPVSFGTEAFYANNAFIFVNSEGQRPAGRYQIVPVGGGQYLDDVTAKGKSPNFLSEELPGRLATAPFKFRLLLQLPNPADQTNDGSVVWPDDRRKVELGIITITAVVPDSAAAEHMSGVCGWEGVPISDFRNCRTLSAWLKDLWPANSATPAAAREASRG